MSTMTGLKTGQMNKTSEIKEKGQTLLKCNTKMQASSYDIQTYLYFQD